MGLLDDLKKQAEAAKGSELSRTEMLQSNIQVTENALKLAAKYFAQLCPQLNVLKPVATRVYYLDQVGELSGFSQGEFFSDHRTGEVEGKDRYKQVLLNFRCTLPAPLQVRRNFDQLESFRKILTRFGMKHTSQAFKNDRGVVTHEVFSITGEFLAQVLWEGDHQNAQIKVTGKHISEFGFVCMLLDARNFNDATLDEFTKLLIGKPSQFWQLGKRVPFTGQGGNL
ncbi:MAG: hypothetical protein JNM76_15460 [Betaproteobacteria bacterium]|nr:hypothetical protein [Betaproteobacteria bacterium]